MRPILSYGQYRVPNCPDKVSLSVYVTRLSSLVHCIVFFEATPRAKMIGVPDGIWYPHTPTSSSLYRADHGARELSRSVSS